MQYYVDVLEAHTNLLTSLFGGKVSIQSIWKAECGEKYDVRLHSKALSLTENSYSCL